MRKTIIALLTAAVVLSLSAAAYAATGRPVTFLPGTQDEVTNLPCAGEFTAGEKYTVPDEVPQREGYEFVHWVLDYAPLDTYRVTYSVAGDPVYGIPGDITGPAAAESFPDGTDVTLPLPETSWVTPDGSAASAVTKYTVKYLKKGTDIPVAESVVVTDAEVGSTATEDAVMVERFALSDEAQKSIKLLPETVGKWTFSGWFRDEALTESVTGITAISADTTVYGKWDYSETTNENVIIFEYAPLYTLTYKLVGDDPFNLDIPEPVTGIEEGSSVTLAEPLKAPEPSPSELLKDSYRVRYLDMNTVSDVAKVKVVTDVAVGTIVTEKALAPEELDVGGYILVGDEEQDLEIKQSYIVKYFFSGWCSDEDCKNYITSADNISEDTTVYGKWESEEIEIARNEIVFYYDEYVDPQGGTYSYTVKYIDIIRGEALIKDKVVTGVKEGTHIVENAEEIDGYELIQPFYEWDMCEDRTIVFIYYPTPSPMN